jgi:hypothetical protein
VFLSASLTAIAATGHAAPQPAPDPPDVVAAREQFVRGSDNARQGRWAEALQAFEASAKLRPHAVTTFDIGICQRAMGSFTLARQTFEQALAQNEASGRTELAESLAAEDRGYSAEIGHLLATAVVDLNPPTATIAVDGRPLGARGEGPSRVMVVGIRDPGPPEPAPGAHFELQLNPGPHVITLSRPGFADAVLTRTMAPGTTTDLKLSLDRLPAVIHVVSSQEGAVVAVNDLDLGVAPIDLSRPAGLYHVVVRKPGYKPYASDVTVRPGEELSLNALLVKHETPLVQRWWFWTIAGAVVAGAAGTTYALTRGQSTVQEPLDGGGLGWVARSK